MRPYKVSVTYQFKRQRMLRTNAAHLHFESNGIAVKFSKRRMQVATSLPAIVVQPLHLSSHCQDTHTQVFFIWQLG